MLCMTTHTLRMTGFAFRHSTAENSGLQVLHLTVMLECDAQGLPFVMFTNVRSLSRPPVSSAVSRGTGLEEEPSRHPQEDPPPAILRISCCALRPALCAALVAFAAAMIRCYIISKGSPLYMEAFSYRG